MNTKKLKKPNVYSYKCDIYPTKLDIMFDINCIEYLNDTYCWEDDPDALFVQDDDDHYGSTYDLLYNKLDMYKTILCTYQVYCITDHT